MRDEPQRCGRIGRATAQSGRDREPLVEPEGAEGRTRVEPGKGACRLKDKIIVALTGLSRAWAANQQFEFAAARQTQPIAEIGKHHEAFKFVIAVVAATEHPQRQIDLGRSILDQRNRQNVPYPPLPAFLGLAASAAEEVSSGKPTLSFCSIFGRSSGSGFKSFACDH